MTEAATLRKFLEQCQNSVTPLTYNDGVQSRKIYITRIGEAVQFNAATGEDETLASIDMVEATGETLETDATGARAGEVFLMRCLNNVTPNVYEHPRWGKMRVFITQMARRPIAEAKNVTDKEFAYALTMVDAWGGIWIYQETGLKITVSKTITLTTHTTAKYGTAKYGFSQYGV